MKEYHIHKDDEQIGPFSETEIKDKLSTRVLGPNDMCWAVGMEDWQPLHATIEMPEVATPPPPPPPSTATPPPPPATPPPPPRSTTQAPGDASSVQTEQNQKPINWIPALVAYCVAFALDLFSSVIMLTGGDGTEGIHTLLLLSALIALGLLLSLHYQCWMAVPEAHRATTPNKAAWFLLIPFFNFYWAFISWPKLVDGLQRAGYPLPENMRPLALAYAILFVCSMTIGLIPGIGILVSVADLILFILLYKGITESINSQRH